MYGNKGGVVMKFFYSFLLFLALIVFPTQSFAVVHIDEGVTANTNDDSSVTVDLDGRNVIARPGHHGGPRPGYHPPPRPNYHPRPVHPRPYYRPVIVHSYTPVVVDPTPTTVVVDETPSTYVSVGNSRFGFGIRGLVAVNSPIYDYELDASGGIGFYLKFRPVRYFSVELMNDYLFGSLKYNDYAVQDYVKVPFVLGARFHFLDYGNVDAYAALAASVSVWSYKDGYDYWYDEYTYMYEVGVQFGGQLGLGVSYIIGDCLEVGADIRYTIETAPDFVPDYAQDRWQSNEAVHGFLLAINLGFAL